MKGGRNFQKFCCGGETSRRQTRSIDISALVAKDRSIDREGFGEKKTKKNLAEDTPPSTRAAAEFVITRPIEAKKNFFFFFFTVL